MYVVRDRLRKVEAMLKYGVSRYSSSADDDREIGLLEVVYYFRGDLILDFGVLTAIQYPLQPQPQPQPRNPPERKIKIQTSRRSLVLEEEGRGEGGIIS